MRQAGRYLPEYRKVRGEAGSFLDLCYSPELASEVTLQPLRRYDLDAAIIFADILVVPHAMGNGLAFVDGEGPVLETVRSGADLERLVAGTGSKQFAAVGQSIARVRSELDKSVSLIGFCGAPWTVASYMIEGKGSDRKLALQCAQDRPKWFSDLIELLVENSIAYLCMQVEAGADALQIFDSWGGELPGELFDDLSVRPIQRIVVGVKARFPSVPVIVFAKGAGERHASIFSGTGCQAVGIEAEFSLEAAVRALPGHAILQGNLDPEALLGEKDALQAAVLQILRGIPRKRHIFNLGHGIKQFTDPEMLSVVVETIREFDRGHAHV